MPVVYVATWACALTLIDVGVDVDVGVGVGVGVAVYAAVLMINLREDYYFASCQYRLQ